MNKGKRPNQSDISRLFCSSRPNETDSQAQRCARLAGISGGNGGELRRWIFRPRRPAAAPPEAGAFDEDARAADLLQEYEAKIAALERMVGRQALEIEFLKGALKSVPRPRSASTSVFTGPTASPSPKDAA